jgi:hypothetical protein
MFLLNMIKETGHFMYCELEDWNRWGFLLRIISLFKKDYIRCLIFRKKWKNKKNIVVLGLKNFNKNKNKKRRTSGWAKKWVSERIDPKCLYCSGDLTIQNATTDHIIPISKGGNNSQVNLVVCCKDCNLERGNLNFYKFYKGDKRFI